MRQSAREQVQVSFALSQQYSTVCALVKGGICQASGCMKPVASRALWERSHEPRRVRGSACLLGDSHAIHTPCNAMQEEGRRREGQEGGSDSS